jgi:hypothetical protein
VSVLRTTVKLIAGETWELPAGVAVLIGVGLAAQHWASSTWDSIGAPAMFAGVVLLLTLTIARGAR